MLNDKTNSRYSLLSIFGALALAVGLTACGGGGAGNNDVLGVDNDTDPRATAIAAITRNVGAPVSASGDIAGNSSVVDTVLGGDGIAVPAASVSSRAVDQDVGVTDEMMNQLEAALGILLSNDVRVGDVITYDPDENALCADALLGNLAELNGDAAMADCVDLFSYITVVLTILSQNEGTVDIKYDGFSLQLIGYSPNSVYFETDLAQWKLIALAEAENNGDPVPELPTTFEGVTRLTFAYLGMDYGRITLSVEEAINVVDTSEGDEVDVRIAATPKVFEFTANGQTEAASLEIGLAAVQAVFPIDAEDNNSGIVQQGELDLKGLTLRAELEAGGNELVVTNVGIGAGPFTFNVVDTVPLSDPVDLSLALDTFGFTVNGLTESVLFDVAFGLNLDVNDVFGVFDGSVGSLSVDVTQNAVIKPLANDVVKVDSGSVTAVGDGDYTGSATYTAGQCFTDNNDFTTDFPFMGATCPAP